MEMNKSTSTVVCLVTLITCFISLGQFVLFLSSHTCLQYPYLRYGSFFSNCRHNNESKFISIIWNVGLIAIFALQHSLQSKNSFKKFLEQRGLGVIERLLYNCGSCVALQILMYYWQPIHSQTLWEISTSEVTVMWWIFSIVHVIAWLTIYSGCFIMDISELLGAKRVYHYFLDWPHPLHQKSEGLLRFYSHMRHPGFSTLSVILFFHPVMQLDRLILAHGFIIYMILAFKVDDFDYSYQKRMLQRKYRNLSLRS